MPDPAKATRPAPPAPPGKARLTIEAIVAVDPPREFRLHPRDRSVAYTAEAAGARQLFVMPLRGGYPQPAHRVGEGRLGPAVVARRPAPRLRPRQGAADRRRRRQPRRDRHLRDRHRAAALVAGRPATRVRRPPPRLVAGLARRRPGAPPRPAGARPASPGACAADRHRRRHRGPRLDAGRRSIAVAAIRPPEHATVEVHLVDVATGAERWIAGGATEWASGPRPLPDGGLLYATDADGWFQIVRRVRRRPRAARS